MKKLTVLLGFLAFLCVQVAFGQTRQITGTVTSAEDGLGIPGASVVVKGTTIGASTDIDGKYTLNVPADATTLVVSYVGMSTQEIEIAGRTTIDVVLTADTQELAEVIILGYSTRVKNSITGSTVQVKGEQLKDIPVITVDQTLQGKVAGLTISTSSGSPGAVQDIRIRGAGSLTAGNDPLIVIDGVPVVNYDFSGDGDARSTLSALSALNSNDIESITVLKDASATSAYGARGSNGVIVITTKKGKAGKTNFNLSTYYAMQNKAAEGRKVLTGAQREELFLEAVFNTYGAAQGFTEDQAYAWASANLPASYLATLNPWIAEGRPVNDWEEAMLNKNAPVQNLMFSASGGTPESSFYTSLGYNKTESIVVGSDFRRLNGSLNFTKNFTEKIKFSSSNTVTNILQNGLLLEQSAYFANPILAKYFFSPWYNVYNQDGTPNLATGSMYNWLYLKDHDITYNDLTRGLTNSYVEWEFLSGFKYKSLVAIDYNIANYKSYANRNYGDALQEGGTVEESVDRNFNYVLQNSVSFNKTIKEHSISAMALIEYQENREKYIYGYGESFVADGLTNISSAGANKDAFASFDDWMNASYLGMVNYNFQGKYVADATYRREGSSRFALGHRFGNFYSVGFAWNISKEDFFSGLTNVVNNFRLRTSYGSSGNSAIGLNTYQALLAYDADYAGQGAVYPSGYGNNLLTWEKNNNFDVGFDFGILNDRVTGSVSYFNKLTSDLLQAVPLSYTSGHNSINKNIGNMLNSGIEAIVDVAAYKSKDFNVNVSLNFATLKNEVTELAKDGEGNYIVIETGTRKIDVGHPLYEWYMREYAGVDPETGNPQWWIYDDEAGTKEKTFDYYAATNRFQGKSAIPTYSGGASLHVDFKGIYFDASLYFAGGHKVFEDWSFYTHHAGIYTTMYYQGVEELTNRWQQPGDITDVPRMYFNTTGNNASRTSTRFLYDGDYVRLKDIVLGYNLPKSVLTKIGYNGTVSVFARGNNLFTWVKDDRLKYDPEVRADGFTRLTNPPIKSLSFGLNLNF